MEKTAVCERADRTYLTAEEVSERRANVVALHPAAIAIYFDAIEQLTNAPSANDAKAACLKRLEFIDGIVVAPRVKPGDPIHLKVHARSNFSGAIEGRPKSV